MASRRRSLIAMVAIVPALLAPLGASEKPRFESHRRDGAITIDGKYGDWGGHLEPFGKEPVSIQFLDDGEFLYMRLSASDPVARMEIGRLGLTVWFDPAGGTKKRFGIRYPVFEEGFERDRGGRGAGSSGSPGDREEEPGAPDRVDVLGPGKDDARSLTREHLQGIEVAIHQEQGTLQYELKVPLAKTAGHPYALEATADTPIGVGIETARAGQRSSSEGRRGGFGGGGMGGRGGGGMGGRGGGMGREGGREGFQQPKPLKSWGVVVLSR